MTEIEVKIRIEDMAAFREKILKAGAVLEKERVREDNILYDFADGRLRRNGQALRVRTIGRKTFLTFKGAPRKSRRFKIREEHETEVKKNKPLHKILKNIGLSQVFRYQKHRAVYRKGRLKICLDETTVGNFCELEGERSDIIRFAESIGFGRSDLIKLDYVRMIIKAGTDPEETGGES